MSSTMLSMVFYGSLIIFFYLGLYIYSLNRYEKIHKLFFGFCMTLSIWALSYSLMNHARTIDGAYLAFRISVLGWGAIYSQMLHLIILYTDNGALLKNWHKVMLYLPVPVTFILFFLGTTNGQISEAMGISSDRWSILDSDILIFRWMILYYFFAMGASIYILLKKLKRTNERVYRNEIITVLISIIISISLRVPVLSSLSSLIKWDYLFFGPNQFLLPVICIFIVLLRRDKRYRSVNIIAPKKGTFLNERTHERIFFYVSQAYIFAAFFAFGLEVILNNKDVISTSILSIVMSFIGIVIIFLNKSRIRTRVRDNMIFFIMALSIPFIILYQISYSASFALVVPTIFILVAVAFNNTKLLSITAISTVGTLGYLWIKNPVSSFIFSEVEHASRLLIFILITYLAFLINRIYKKRLLQIEKQIEHERFISEMAVHLSKARNSNHRSNLDVFLDYSVKYMDADYGCIHIFSSNQKKIRKTEGHGRYDLTGTKNNWFYTKDIDQLMKRLAENILSQEEFMHELELFRNKLEGNGIKVMIAPLEASGNILGVMCMGSTRVRMWDDSYFNTFNLIAGSLSGMIYKIRNEDRLYRMAYYDSLTGLSNRIHFNKTVAKIIRETKKGEMFAMIFLDLDNFKNINDLLGHNVGDRFLVELTARIKSKLKTEDYMSRFGGDEFLIVLPDVTTMDDATLYAKEILDDISIPISLGDREVTTGGSIGISIFPQDGENPEDLIKNADLAMYISKSRGKNRITVCSEEIRSRFVEEAELENELREAVGKNELTLYYQPKVDGVTEEIVGVEALIRWNHPVKGMISPGVFLPIAERIGIQQSIDSWVFMKACDQNLKWQDKGYDKINMSINVSPVSLMESELSSHLDIIFSKHRWDPQYIEIEITENQMNLAVDNIKKRLSYLREVGMRISLDDFGTAYSSLSRLHELPIDKVKIDRQFILNLDQRKGGRNLYDGILYLSKSLGLKVTVEGVETKEQTDYIRKMGCDEIQGYYYYKPMPPEEIEGLLKKIDPETLISGL